MRSAVALGLGQKPVKQIPREGKEAMEGLANTWYLLPDSSTHSAVTWLMQQWDLPEPTVVDASNMVEGRNWLTNSQGVKFVRINPPKEIMLTWMDPTSEFRSEVTEFEKTTPAENADYTSDRIYRIGPSFYYLGQHDRALSELGKAKELLHNQDTRLEKQLDLYTYLTLGALKKNEEILRLRNQKYPYGEWAKRAHDSLASLCMGNKEKGIAELNSILEGIDRESNHQAWFLNKLEPDPEIGRAHV